MTYVSGLEREFTLDPFQVEAIAALDRGSSVIVAAPTGAGKTVIAEHGIDLALESGTKAFYTTPIKALSNQKYHDFADRYGSDQVGLLTGDTSINGEASVVVMTTEVLRNMLYANSSTLAGLTTVVLDEVHYLQDQYRGPVWEEVIVHTPNTVRFVCLSATVSNARELADWLEAVQGPTELIVHEQRPVELTNLYMIGDRDAAKPHLIPTLVSGEPNPEGNRFHNSRPKKGRKQRGRTRRRFTTPRRFEVLDALQDRDLLPAISFVFSRAGCDEAARQLVDAGVVLTDTREKQEIRELIEIHTGHLGDEDREVLGFSRFARSLERGVAAHHAGMVPAFKETVEACFAAGLVKLVFATETLALGINMPARAVVIERLTKFNGDTHEFLTPLEYTQLTGRAGRRGIDDQGYAIALWSPFVEFDQVASLASSRAFSLRSVFRPTYNMAINLVRLHDREGAHRLLDQSFGQYQADRDLTQMSQRRERLSDELRAVELELRARGLDPDSLGTPASEMAESEEAGGDNSHDRAAVVAALSSLVPGDVVMTPDSGRAEPAAVLSVSYRRGGTMKLFMVGRSHRRLTLSEEDFASPPDVIGSIVMPQPYQPNNGGYQHEVVRKLQRARLKRKRKTSSAGREQPEAQTTNPTKPDPLVEKLNTKRRQLRRIDQRMEGRTTRLARQFDDIVGVLQMRGYVSDWQPTQAGRILEGIFHESDLAIAESIRLGVLDGLDHSELAALVSCFTYEHRGPNPAVSPRIRSSTLRRAFSEIDVIVSELRDTESDVGVRLTPELDAGFATMAAAWASGESLSEILDPDLDITGGDFVRQVRQLIDVLGQVGNVAPDPDTAANARRAAESLRRGVIIASALIEEDDDLAG